MRTATVAWLSVAALVTTACGAGDTPGATDTTTDTTTTTRPDRTETSTETTTRTQTTTQTTTQTAVTPPPAGDSCAVTADWTLRPDVERGRGTQPVHQVRAGRHACYDRVVFDLRGQAGTGFDVRYVDQVHAEGSGKPVPVAGNAALQVTVRSPARSLAGVGEHFFAERYLADWGALRSVRFAGSFEGQSTFALGARATLPMRAFSLVDQQRDVRQVVVDIAHHPN